MHDDRSASDVSLKTSPLNKVQAISMSRTYSSPGNFEGSIDRPMRLAEIFVASEHALKQTISNPDLHKTLSSIQDFEVSNWGYTYVNYSCFHLWKPLFLFCWWKGGGEDNLFFSYSVPVCWIRFTGQSLCPLRWLSPSKN